MTVLVQEIGHDLVSVCLHHAYAVIIATIVAYHLVLQFTMGKEISVIVTLKAFLMFSCVTGFEMVICHVA